MLMACVTASMVFSLNCTTVFAEETDVKAFSGQTLEVATLNGAAPIAYEEDGELTGFEIDLVNAIAEEMGVTVNYNIMSFDAMIPALQADQVDMAIAGFFVTDERKKVIDFSESDFSEGNALAVPVDSDIASFDDLDGKVLIAKTGGASETAANELAEKYNATVSVYEDDSSMYMALSTGNGDALVYDSVSIAYYISQEEEATLKIVDMVDTSDCAIALQKDSELTPVVNKAIENLKENGTFDEIYSKYLGTTDTDATENSEK